MPPSPSESGPDFSTFEGGTGAAGGIIGTSQLQTAITEFTQAVTKLDGIASKMGSGNGGFQQGATQGPTGGSPWGATNSSVISPSNIFAPGQAYGSANAGGASFTPTGGMGAPTEGMPGGPGSGGTGGGGGSGGGGNGGWGFPAGGGFTPTSVAGGVAAGMGAGGGIVQGAARTALSFAPAPIGAAVGGLASAGSQAQPSQIALNTLQYQSALSGQSYNTTRMGAMGTAGTAMGGQQQIEWGMNPSDMAATYATLQQTTGQLNPYANTPGARNVMGAMGAANIANPGMSGQQNSSMIQGLYSPQTSMNMMMMGYPTTPRQMGTGAPTPMGSLFAPFMNRLGGGKAMNPNQLAAMMAPGMTGSVGLSNLTGMAQGSPQLQQATNVIEMQNTLMTGDGGKQKNMSLGQVNTLFGELSSSNQPTFKKAENQLQAYGIPQSDIQAQKSQAGNQAQTISDTSQGFTAGLQSSVRALSDFNTALHKIVNSIPGARGVLGTAESFVSNILGGGAGAPGGVSQTTSKGSSAQSAMSSTVNAKAGQAVHLAQTQLGVPYAYGMESPGKGFDCSALPQWAYKAAGITLPRTATDQLRALSGNLVSTQQVQEGDLVFKPGVGANAHEAMLVDQGKNIIEAKGVGSPIAVRPYNHGEWEQAARPWQQGKGLPKNAPAAGSKNVKGGGATPAAKPAAAPASSSIAQAMEKYMMARKGDAYSESNRWGRPPYDCSSLLWSAANASGLKIPGDPSTDSGDVLANTEANWIGEQKGVTKNTVASKIRTNDILFFTGAGPGPSNYGGIGHVGMAASPTVMISAYDTASGVTTTPIGQDKFVVGFTLGGGGATSPGTTTTTAGTTTTTQGAAAGLGGLSAGLGDYEDEGSSTELDAFGGAILGGGFGGGGTSTTTKTTGSGSTPAPNGGTPAGNGQTGTMALAKYLVSAGYSKPAAAAAAAVANGEGGGNPESYQGNGGASLAQAKAWKATSFNTQNLGAGLIGWTPASSMSKYGGTYATTVAADMASQEKAMVSWMKTFGWGPPQSGFADSAAGALKAAYSASAAYERPAVPGSDVSASEVTQVYNSLATGGAMAAGTTSWVGERGPELISVTKDSTVHNAADSARLAQSMAAPGQGPWSAGPTGGYQYSTAHPLYSGSNGTNGNGVQVTFASGAVVINAPTSAASMSTTGNDGASVAQTFTKQLQSELAKMNVASAIGAGVSS